MPQCRKDAPRRRAAMFAASLLLTPVVAGCSTAQIDSLPKGIGGLPEGAPQRPANPLTYPAVHDIPPDRSKPLLDDDERKRMEADLEAARNRLQAQQKAAGKTSDKPARDKAAAKADAAEKKGRPTVRRDRRPTALPKEEGQ